MKLLLLLPIILVLSLISVTAIQQDAFAQSSGMTIMASADKGSDIITVVGKTTSNIADVTFRVTSPSGNNVVAVKQISPNDNGKFMWELKVTQVWRENGFYKIEATQGLVQNSLYAVHVIVEVNNRMTEKTFVTDSNFDSNLDTPVHNSITVQTDKSSYSPGETIHITGKVRDLYSGTPVSVTMKAPNGNLVLIQQVSVNSDKTFDTSYDNTRNNILMRAVGDYTITVQYGTANRSAETTFEFGGDATPIYPKTYTGESKSKCGAGTVFDKVSNSCVLKEYRGNTGSENSRLKAEIRDLKEQNNILQSEIRDLRNIIYQQLDTIMKTLQRLN